MSVVQHSSGAALATPPPTFGESAPMLLLLCPRPPLMPLVELTPAPNVTLLVAPNPLEGVLAPLPRTRKALATDVVVRKLRGLNRGLSNGTPGEAEAPEAAATPPPSMLELEAWRAPSPPPVEWRPGAPPFWLLSSTEAPDVRRGARPLVGDTLVRPKLLARSMPPPDPVCRKGGTPTLLAPRATCPDWRWRPGDVLRPWLWGLFGDVLGRGGFGGCQTICRLSRRLPGLLGLPGVRAPAAPLPAPASWAPPPGLLRRKRCASCDALPLSNFCHCVDEFASEDAALAGTASREAEETRLLAGDVRDGGSAHSLGFIGGDFA